MTTFYKKNGWQDVKNCIPQKLLKNFRRDLDNIAKANKYNNFNSLIVNLSKKNKNKLRDINVLSNRLTSFLEYKPQWLSKEKISRKWFGIRARPDGEPSPIQKNLEDGLILCTGFYKNGFLLAPACSRWVASELEKFFL